MPRLSIQMCIATCERTWGPFLWLQCALEQRRLLIAIGFGPVTLAHKSTNYGDVMSPNL